MTYRCWGCDVTVESDARPRCPTPRCGILMDPSVVSEKLRRALDVYFDVMRGVLGRLGER